MADYSIVSPSEAFKYQFQAEAAQLRVALPGVIISFDAASQTVTARPACRMKVNVGDGVKFVDLPVIENVPVVIPFAQTAGLLLTLPIRPGDECLLVFSDRAIDFFVRDGGVRDSETSAQDDVSSPRQHHLTDAVCIPGIVSNPQAVPQYSTDHIELRDRERVAYISLGPTGITMTDGLAKWTMSGGRVTLAAPSGIDYETPVNFDVRSRNMDLSDNNRIDGCLTSENGTFIDRDGVVLGTHTHNHGAEPDHGGGGAG